MGDYDQFAETYAELTAQLEQQTRERLYGLLPADLTGLQILDVGCGSGHDAAYYTTNGARVTGIDVSQKEIDLARERSSGIFQVGSMDRLPFPAAEFDLVTSMYALQTSANVEHALLEMLRVTKQGGTITVVTKHPFRNLLESYVNDERGDYFSNYLVTSHIFGGKITLHEPGHRLEQYLSPRVLQGTHLSHCSEHNDFPASAQVMPGLQYPTYLLLQYQKC